MGKLETVPARRGRAVRLRAGQAIRIINTHGTQVVDTWAFNADDPTEFLSMEHMHASLGSIFPALGDGLFSNRRRPILTLEEDTSPGRHDTVIAACDVHRYRSLGCTEYHDNCTDNLHAALDHGKPDYAILDVFNHEPPVEDSWVWAHPRVSLTPLRKFWLAWKVQALGRL